MTLREYLASPDAIADVDALLTSSEIEESEDGERFLSRNTTEKNTADWWLIPPGGALHSVGLDYGEDQKHGIAACYYRATATGYVISDCGESVSRVMRRRGCSWLEAHAWVGSIVTDSAIFFGHSTDGDICHVIDGHKHSDDLPTAIVRVLRAVSACSEKK